MQFSGTQQPQTAGRPLQASLLKKTRTAEQVPGAEVHRRHPAGPGRDKSRTRGEGTTHGEGVGGRPTQVGKTKESRRANHSPVSSTCLPLQMSPRELEPGSEAAAERSQQAPPEPLHVPSPVSARLGLWGPSLLASGHPIPPA